MSKYILRIKCENRHLWALGGTEEQPLIAMDTRKIDIILIWHSKMERKWKLNPSLFEIRYVHEMTDL